MKIFEFESPLCDLIKKDEDDSSSFKDTLWNKLANLGYSYSSVFLSYEEGWVFECNKKGKKGKKICKLYENLFQDGYKNNNITFWRPKLQDIVTCEAKRWKAKQYYENQIKKILPTFDLVSKNTPFCCIRKTKNWPGFAWVEFSSVNNGVSWNWWNKENERPDSPLKQNIGDKWFEYESRSYQLLDRFNCFKMLFHRAISNEYAKKFYDKNFHKKINLVINERNYIIGMKNNQEFGVIVYPEDIITQVLKS